MPGLTVTSGGAGAAPSTETTVFPPAATGTPGWVQSSSPVSTSYVENSCRVVDNDATPSPSTNPTPGSPGVNGTRQISAPLAESSPTIDGCPSSQGTRVASTRSPRTARTCVSTGTVSSASQQVSPVTGSSATTAGHRAGDGSGITERDEHAPPGAGTVDAGGTVEIGPAVDRFVDSAGVGRDSVSAPLPHPAITTATITRNRNRTTSPISAAEEPTSSAWTLSRNRRRHHSAYM